MSEWEGAGQSDEWYTPRYIFDALDCRFDMDVAAPIDGPRHVPCRKWLWKGQTVDGLKNAWSGLVWCNSPFGARNGIKPWLDKFFAHGDGIALMPDRTSAPWFQEAARKADAILFLSPKVKFERPDGTVGKSPGSGTALMAAGARGAAVLRHARPLGLVVFPERATP